MSKPTIPQGKKWQLTINNPAEKNFDHNRIKEAIANLSTTIYYCMADEIGNEGETPHTHVFIVFSSPVRFTTIKKQFPTAHIEKANGTNLENKQYIEKTGRWLADEKADTSIEGTFEEWGEMPLDRPKGTNIESIILERIRDGARNAEILDEFPDQWRKIRDVEHARQILKNEEYRDRWRDLEITYIFGAAGTGKTRSVMDGHGYSNVYAVNDYKHPFDGYAGEDVLLFDEFSSGIRIQDMNNYLDGYPIALPARYSNKQACYERVYIISNIGLKRQYEREQGLYSEIWEAFLRRIHNVVQFMPDGTKKEYTTKEYMALVNNFTELPPHIPTPFDDAPTQLDIEGGSL